MRALIFLLLLPCLLFFLLGCHPSFGQTDPYAYLSGDWEIIRYERGEMDYSELMKKVLVRIGPCNKENNLCRARLIPQKKYKEAIRELMENRLEIDFHLRAPDESLELASELGVELPNGCAPCYTIQDDIHQKHIYAGFPEDEDTIRFALLSRKDPESFTLHRIRREK
jgi:hypothetical protein